MAYSLWKKLIAYSPWQMEGTYTLLAIRYEL